MRLIRLITPSYVDTDFDRLLRSKLQTLNLLVLGSIAVILFMGMVRLQQHNYLQAGVDLVYVAIATVSYAVLNRSPRYYTVVSRTLLGMAILPSVLVITTAPESQGRLLWLAPLIMMAFFLRGRKEGVLWTAAVIGVLTLIYVTAPGSLHLSGVDFFIFTLNLLFIGTAMVWYETVKEQTQRVLRNTNELLEGKVAERTAELEAETLRAEAANRAKSAFLANMSHDLRTPLNAILGFSQILQRHPDTAPMCRDRVEKIAVAGRQLLNLVNTILDFSKIESGKTEFRPTRIALPVLCKTLHTIFDVQAAQKRVTLLLPAETGEIVADEQLIIQLFTNLIANALKFAPEGSTVGMEYAWDAGTKRHRFLVTDQGSGIAEDEIEQIFEPFVQGSGGEHRAVKGTGLGLALCRKIAVELHGGMIRVENRPEGGSRFVVELPKLQIAQV